MTLAQFLTGYATVSAVMSVVTFAAYGIDKQQAIRAGRRISERRLHQFALWCGWPGAWLGQQVFRHKTQKKSFRIVFWLIVLLHIAGLIAAAVYWPQAR